MENCCCDCCSCFFHCCSCCFFSPAVAIEEAPDLRRKDPRAPPAIDEAPNLRRKDSHDASSSAPTPNPANVDHDSNPSTISEHTKKIIEDATAADGQNDNINLVGLIEDMSQLLKIIKTKSSDKRPSTDHYWPRSTIFYKLKEILSEATDGALDLKSTSSSQNSSEAMKIVQDLLAGIGHAHWAAAGLLVVANILERFEMVRANVDECLSVLEEMSNLAQHVQDLKERLPLKKGMEVSVKKATEMIVEGALMCCTQMNSSRISRFFLTSVNKDKLTTFQQKLQKMYKRMNDQMLICIFDAIECKNMRPQLERERSYPQYAVGIEEPLEEVIELLDWENDKNAVAVILHGLGGMGKSTLADAVFARLYIEDCKYSMVRLFENIGSTPNVVDLQKTILKDLSTGTEEEEIPGSEDEIRTFEEGQIAIGKVLEKRVAFIYIDNVFRDPTRFSTDPLEQLLPRDFINAKKVRLLVTARNQDVVRGCRMEAFKFYPMKYLPPPEARNVLNQELGSSAREHLKSDQLSEIVNISGGIPKLLSVIAGFIRTEEDKQIAYNIVMEEKNKWKGQVGNVESYLFAYDCIPEMEQESFLDICSFFIGWPWNKVQNIVGMSNLNMLSKRSLVMKNEKMTVNVHDVILTIAREKAKADGTRSKFSGHFGNLNSNGDLENGINKAQSEINNFSKKDIQGIKGLWFEYNLKRTLYITSEELYITSEKLDSMCNSLKILSLGNLVKVQGDCQNIFEKMIFFKGGVPYPFNISQSQELRYLECQPQDLNFLTQVPSNLKHMKLDGKLHSKDAFKISSTHLQQLRNLQTLELINFVGLKQLPEGLGDIIKDLQELNLSNCISIEKLPRSISTLQFLKILKMRKCLSLKELPKDFESLNSLTELKLQGCASLKVLLSHLDKLIELRSLDVSQWINVLNDLPQSEREKVDPTFISIVQEFAHTGFVQEFAHTGFPKLLGRVYVRARLMQSVRSEWMKKQRIGDVSTKVTRAILSCISDDDTLNQLNLIL